MAYNLDDLWDRVDTEWSTLSAKALVAIAIELRALCRVLQEELPKETKIGGSE